MGKKLTPPQRRKNKQFIESIKNTGAYAWALPLSFVRISAVDPRMTFRPLLRLLLRQGLCSVVADNWQNAMSLHHTVHGFDVPAVCLY
jgi:hypothetical protein